MPTLAQSFSNGIRAAVGRLFSGEGELSRSESEPKLIEQHGLRAQCRWKWPDDSAFRAAWNDLLSRSALAATFQSAAWLRDGVAIRPGALRLITVEKAGRLIALVPLEFSPGGFLDSAGYAVSDYLDPLTDPSEAQAAWRMILTLLRENWGGNVKGVTLHNLPPEAVCRSALAEVAADEGFISEQTITSNAARIALPASWDEYLESLDSHERKELRRKIRKAETQAGARLELSDESKLERCLNLIEASNPDKRDWLQTHVRPVLTRAGAQLLREGRMRLPTLILNEEPAACLIDFPSKQGPLLYNSGFDPAQRQWSPGAVTFGLAIKDAIERKQAIFDMLRGREEYKYRLGAKDEPVYRIALRPR